MSHSRKPHVTVKRNSASSGLSSRSQKNPIASTSEQNSASSGSFPCLALVCDWLTTPGGAEKVLLELHKMYPDAPIYTSQYNKKGINWFDDATVKTGWLQIFPSRLRKILGPLRQIYFSRLDLSEYDVVISVTGAEAKSIRTHKKRKPLSSNYSTEADATYHLCYCHVPTQYYWQMYDKYVENPGFGLLNPLVRAVFKLLVKPLRNADYRAAQRPDQFITISNYAQAQIQKYYRRESIIIAPPVEIERFLPSSPSTLSSQNQQKLTQAEQDISKASSQQTLIASKKTFSTEKSPKSTRFPQSNGELSTKTQDFSTRNPQEVVDFSTNNLLKNTRFRPFQYYIIACRQVTWKRVDLAIQACLQENTPLLVVGDGPERQRLLQLASGSELIQFLPWVQPEELAIYLQNAKAYLFPSLEPFGIAAVEALAAGCPVIAYAEGGSRDFIQDRQNGLLFPEQTAASLAQALRRFSQLSFDRQKIARTAAQFSSMVFRQKIQAAIQEALRPLELSQSSEPPQSPRSSKSASLSGSSKNHSASLKNNTNSSKGTKL